MDRPHLARGADHPVSGHPPGGAGPGRPAGVSIDPAVAARVRELYAQGDKGSRLQANPRSCGRRPGWGWLTRCGSPTSWARPSAPDAACADHSLGRSLILPPYAGAFAGRHRARPPCAGPERGVDDSLGDPRSCLKRNWVPVA